MATRVSVESPQLDPFNGGPKEEDQARLFLVKIVKTILVKIVFVCVLRKVSSCMWDMCPKILGGYKYQNPLNGEPKGKGVG